MIIRFLLLFVVVEFISKDFFKGILFWVVWIYLDVNDNDKLFYFVFFFFFFYVPRESFFLLLIYLGGVEN